MRALLLVFAAALATAPAGCGGKTTPPRPPKPVPDRPTEPKGAPDGDRPADAPAEATPGTPSLHFR